MEIDRKLASIRTISSIRDIPDADSIDCATIDGWNCVVKKGEFSPGDLCVYFEIDSVLPERPEYEFLRPKKFRIKTVRLRGQLSQGLCIPLSVAGVSGVEGDDVTESLGVTKYEPHASNGGGGGFKHGRTAGTFPFFLTKTDQERIQNLTKVIDHYRDEPFEVTEKLEGTSRTVFLYDGVTGHCSRNNIEEPSEGSLPGQIEAKYNVMERLLSYGKNIALQGEGIGQKIQGNIYKLQDIDFMIFDVYLIDERRYAVPEERLRILDDLKMDNRVPVIDEKFVIGSMTIPEILEYATASSKLYEGTLREGLVFKSHNLNKFGCPFSFKAVSNEYLLGKKG